MINHIVINHLTQSTIFAGVVAIFVFAMRGRPAGMRHALWLAASVKFLIPFAALVWIGSHLGIPVAGAPAEANPSGLLFAFGDTAPETAATHTLRTPSGSALPAWTFFAVWVSGLVVVAFTWIRQWWRVRTALRRARPAGLVIGVPAVSSEARLEPGIFGIFRPVLVLPEGIAERLSPAELQAIIAHELCHVRRRDNLAAAIHAVVEAIFWFHPLVWWLEHRMNEERERACDEAVLQSGSEPRAYAEGILKVCEFYLAAPSMCVAGVSGADLKRRIEEIVAARASRAIDPIRKIVLAAAAIATVAAPIVVGVFNAPRLSAQTTARRQLSFEVATIKLNSSDDHRMGWQTLPGGRLIAHGLPLRMLIALAYDIPFQSARLTGGPDWASGVRWDIEAKADPATLQGAETAREREERMRAMVQTLLRDRFKLALRTETKEVPVYELLVGRRGAKLEKSKTQEKDCSESAEEKTPECHSFHGGVGRGAHAEAASLVDFAQFVSNWTDKPVIDRTRIDGLYKFDTEGWQPMRVRPPGSEEGPEAQALADPTRPTLEMILDRLGLRISATKAPLEMYVIERAEKPAEN